MEGNREAVAQAVLGRRKAAAAGVCILEGGPRVWTMLFKGGKGHPRKTCLFLSQETGKEVGLTLGDVELGRKVGT